MEKMLDLINSLVDSLKRLQDKVLKLESQRKLFVTKETLREFNEKINYKLKELNETLRRVENEYKDIRSSLESKFYDLDEELRLVKSQITNLVNVEEYSRLNVELFNIKAKLREMEEHLKSLDGYLKKIQQIEENLSKISEKLIVLSKKMEGFEKIKDVEKIIKNIDDLKYSVDFLTNKINNIEKEYEELLGKVSEIETDAIANLMEEVQKIKEGMKDEVSLFREELEELKYLKNISNFDIEKLKRMPNVEEISKRVQEIESKTQLINSIINELSRMVYDIRSNISKVLTQQVKIEGVEKDIEALDKLYRDIGKTITSLKEEVKDIKDIVLVTAKENEDLRRRMSELETKIKIENIEEVLDAFERIKLLEEDIRNIKQILAGYTVQPKQETDVTLKIRQLESAIRKLYEQQNSILYSLNEKLARLERMLNK